MARTLIEVLKDSVEQQCTRFLKGDFGSDKMKARLMGITTVVTLMELSGHLSSEELEHLTHHSVSQQVEAERLDMLKRIRKEA